MATQASGFSILTLVDVWGCHLFNCVNSERDLFYVDNTRQVRGCCQGTLGEEVE